MADFLSASTGLLLQSPFFGTLLMKLRHKEYAQLQPPTAAISKTTLFYHPGFMDKLTTEEGVFVVAHEVGHAALMHLDRMQAYITSGLGPDGKKYDHARMNRACDYVVNHSLVLSSVGDVPRKEIIQICLDPKKYPCTLTPEEIYVLLEEADERGEGGPGAMDGHDLGEHGPGAGSDGSDPMVGQGITAADILQAANVHKMTTGTLPAGFERMIEELRRPRVSPWARLRRLVTNAMSGYDATTWRRLQRRMIVRGIGMPGRTAFGAGRIGVVGDTSGSIGAEMLALFGGHMASIMAEARPQELRVYWTDARVHRVDVAKTPSQLVSLMRKGAPGGGGTDMRKGVQAAIEDKCDIIVVLTDGYTPFCDAPKPVVWAITSPGVTSPYGETVHIAEE